MATETKAPRPERLTTHAVCVPKGYHTGDKNRHGGAQLWSTGGPGVARPVLELTRLHACTAFDCDQQEALGSDGKVRSFQMCSKCRTKYCSIECQRRDHREGQHKVKCAAYVAEQEKERLRYADCPTCSLRWNKPNFVLCATCLFKA